MNCSSRAGAALLLAALAVAPARATLGEDLASVQADTLRLAARRSVDGTLPSPVHTLTLADGSTIRQHLGRDGRVWAIRWRTRFKPRLDQLLGSHFPAYAQAARQALQQRTGPRHHAALRQGDLVVESTAHLGSHVGHAYLRSRVPDGLPDGTLPDALR